MRVPYDCVFITIMLVGETFNENVLPYGLYGIPRSGVLNRFTRTLS